MSGLTKSKERVRKFGEVYTPEWMVKEMCDLLDAESPDAFTVLTRTFLEPACGNGNFLVEVLSRKLAICETAFDAAVACATIYGIDILEDNVLESRERMERLVAEKFPAAKVHDILERHIVRADSLKLQRILEKAPDWDSAVAEYRAEECAGTEV